MGRAAPRLLGSLALLLVAGERNFQTRLPLAVGGSSRPSWKSGLIARRCQGTKPPSFLQVLLMRHPSSPQAWQFSCDPCDHAGVRAEPLSPVPPVTTGCANLSKSHLSGVEGISEALRDKGRHDHAVCALQRVCAGPEFRS